MSISEHEQQVLETIESNLAPAAMLGMFARLTADEEMPTRERVRHAFDAPPAPSMGAIGSGAASRATHPRRAMQHLRNQAAWLCGWRSHHADDLGVGLRPWGRSGRMPSGADGSLPPATRAARAGRHREQRDVTE